jgi:hypothetical protein
MQIDNASVLLIGFAVSLLGVIGCLYIIIRSVRKMLGGDQAPRRESATRRSESKPGGGGWLGRAKEWLSEPVTSSPSGKEPRSAEVSPAGAPLRSAQDSRAPGGLSSEGGVLEVMRILRAGTLGELVIEVEGKRYRRLVDIQDGAVGRRVLLAIQELNEFAGGHARRPLPEMHRVPAPTAQPIQGEPDFTPQQQAFLADLQETQVEEAAPEPKPSLVSYWRKGLKRSERQAAAEAAEQEPKSFVDEIEGLLQEGLAGRPDMQGRSIHFKSTPMGDLRIEVDGSWYETVDAVPDAEAKGLLQAAIKAWEQG